MTLANNDDDVVTVSCPDIGVTFDVKVEGESP